jgi:hypothetical protein
MDAQSPTEDNDGIPMDGTVVVKNGKCLVAWSRV